MRPDLQGLEITPGELRHLSGMGMNHIYRPPTWQKFLQEGFQTLIASGLIFISYRILILISPRDQLILMIIHILAVVSVLIEDLYTLIRTLTYPNLIRIVEDVDRYNAIVKAIVINDEIEEAGNFNVRIDQRDRVLKALHLIREDLVRALKTEKILRKNYKFLQENEQLFATNLTTLTALQISDRATEHGRLLNEALQIAVGVQEELQRLQDQHSAR